MPSSIKDILAFACQAMLHPIVRILLRSGMTYKEFEAQARLVFVDVGTSDFGIRGRPANASRVAIMTGLSRREVQRLRDLSLASSSEGVQAIDRASRVLAAWHDDEQFCSSQGKPLPLNETGPSPSFSELFSKYGGDVPSTAMLKELTRSGAVERRKDGKLVARHRYYMPVRTDAALLERAATVIADVGRTVNHNLNRSAKVRSSFEGRATNLSIAVPDVPAFQDYLEEHAQALLDDADKWLAEREQAAHSKGIVRLGVGVYLINDR